MPENPHGSTDTQAFGQGAEDFPHAVRRGFEAVQDRTIADAEFGLAGLALEILDVFSATAARPAGNRRANDRVAAAADESVGVFVGDAVVKAVGIGAGVASRHDPLLAERAARVFDL